MTRPHPQMLLGYRQGSGPVLALHLGNDEFAVVGTKDGGSLTDTGRADVLLYGVAGIGYLYGS